MNNTSLLSLLERKGTFQNASKTALFMTLYSDLFMMPSAFAAKSIYDERVRGKKKHS
jgi:hypothetical protein